MYIYIYIYIYIKLPSLNALFERMSGYLFQLLGRSWSPPTMIEDPVVWRKREYNKIADFIVNCTMDCREDLHEDCEPPLPYDRQRVNYICHSDGGMRAGNCSAAAWYLEAVVTTDKAGAITFPVAMPLELSEGPSP